MCFAMNIPSDTATDYTMSITAPDKIGYLTITSEADGSWAAVGIGNQMAGSLMFIIAKNNGNITLSVRLAEYVLF